MMAWYRNGDHRIEDLRMEPADRGRARTDLREVCVNRAAYSGRRIDDPAHLAYNRLPPG